MKQPKNIQDVEEFNDYAVDILENFIEDFDTRIGLTMELDEDCGLDPEYCAYAYTNRGWKLIERMKERLTKVGEKYFDRLDIEIETSLIIEP